MYPKLPRACSRLAQDGAWHERGGEFCWQGLSHLKTSEVGGVLESAVLRMERYLRRRGLLGSDEDELAARFGVDDSGNDIGVATLQAGMIRSQAATATISKVRP